MKFIVTLVALVHVVLSQDTSTTPVPVFKDTNANGVNAGNMNGIGDPGNMNPGNLNPGAAGGMGVNNYPVAVGGGNFGSSTTVIPGVGINVAGQAAGITAGGSVLGGGDDSSSSEENSELEMSEVPESSVVGGAAVEEADSPDTPDNEVNNNANAAGGAGGTGNANVGRGDQEFNEIGDTPDNAENMVDAGMGEQVGTSSTGATAGILVAVVVVVAAAVGVGLYVVKQRRNNFSTSNV